MGWTPPANHSGKCWWACVWVGASATRITKSTAYNEHQAPADTATSEHAQHKVHMSMQHAAMCTASRAVHDGGFCTQPGTERSHTRKVMQPPNRRAVMPTQHHSHAGQQNASHHDNAHNTNMHKPQACSGLLHLARLPQAGDEFVTASAVRAAGSPKPLKQHECLLLRFPDSASNTQA